MTALERAGHDLPFGGTTGLDHQSTASIDEASAWLASQMAPPSPIVPALRARFGLDTKEACIAIHDAARRRSAVA